MFQIKRFLISRFFAALGDQFMLFAVPLAVYKITGSIKYSGLAFAVEWLPRLLFFPLSGSVADQINPRKIFVFVDGIRAFVVGVAIFFIAQNVAGTFVILALCMAILSIGQSLVFVAIEATLPREMPPEELPKAHSLLQGIDQISQILGPAIAAFASQALGLSWVLAIGGLLFVISTINAIGIHIKTESIQKQPIRFKNITKPYLVAWGVLRSNPILFQLCGLTWIVNLVYGAALVASPLMILKIFGRDNFHFGIMQTFAGLASVLVFIAIPYFTKILGLPMLGLISMSLMLFSGFVLSISGSMVFSFGLYVTAYMVLMGMDGAFNVYIRSLRGQIIPKNHLGKVTGLIILLNNSSLPLTGLAIAKLSNFMSTPEMLQFICITAVVLAVITLAIGKRKLKYMTLVPSL